MNEYKGKIAAKEMRMKDWQRKGKDLIKEYNEENESKRKEEIKKIIERRALLKELKTTVSDAEKMVIFFKSGVAHFPEDVTVMCQKEDFKRFELNLN